MKKSKYMAGGGAMKGTKYKAKGGGMKKSKYMAKGGAMKGTKYMAMGGAAKSEMKANPGMGKMPKSVVDALEGTGTRVVGTAGKVLKKLGPQKSTLRKDLQALVKKSKKNPPTGGMR
jgi:predicted metal-dependent phosphotriesterase family hydrolase